MTGKTTITKIILPLFCIAFLAVAFWYSQENRSADGQSPKILNSPKIAQAQVGISSIICDEPIPMGSAMEETVGIMDDVFQVYQYNYLNLAIEHIRGIVTALSENPTVCDFSKCSPYVKNRGPGLGLAVKTYGLEALWGDDSGSIKYSLRIPPLCDAEECLGQACPDISQHLVDNQSIMGLKTLQKTFETSGTIIRQIFDEKSQTVTEDFNLTGQELPSTKITRPELALRKIELSDEWLSPAVGPIQSCSLTASQRDQAAKGLFTERYPMRCQDALNQMVYWPKVWSEACSKQCQDGPSPECVKCLGDKTKPPSENTSFLAKVNYKIYGTCLDFCQNELTAACLNCLCLDPITQERWTDDQCRAWICGGSTSNYVCCSQAPRDDLEKLEEILGPLN